MKKAISIIFNLLFTLLLPACSLLPQKSATELPDSTFVYETVSAGLTETAISPEHPEQFTNTPLPSPSSTPIPSPAVTSSPSATGIADKPATQTPTRRVVPCNLAAPGRPYVDISVPDGTHFKPGQGFSKTWRLVNAGSCKWTSDYAIAWFSGEVFGAVAEQPFGMEVRPGQSIDITVEMIAPMQSGVHQSNWKLSDANGVLFGIGPNGDAPFWIRIEVESLATVTLTPQPTFTVTPTLAAVAKGIILLKVGNPVDLDSTNENSGLENDIELQEQDGNPMVLALLNGAAAAEVTGQSPVLSDCLNASLQNQPIAVANLKDGSTFCYRTNKGLPGFFNVKSLALDDKILSIDFLTWAIP